MNADRVEEEKPEFISHLSLIRDRRDPSLALGILKHKAANQKSSEAEHAPSCAATGAGECEVEM
jgi:hypothetical protein